jgi:hypothetical protein
MRLKRSACVVPDWQRSRRSWVVGVLPLIVFVGLAIFAPFHIASALVFGIVSAIALVTGWSTWGLGRRLGTWFGRRIYCFYCRLAFIALE